MSKKSRQKRWSFASTGQTATITPIVPVELTPPTVYYTPEAYAVIQLAVAHCSKEVGWWGMVEKMEDGYLISDIYIPEQTVTGAETDIDSDAMAALALQLMESNRDPSKLCYWGHSHVNMGVSPSGQDEAQVEEYLDNMPLIIRGIYNKKGEAKVDVYDRERGVVFQCVPTQLYVMDPTTEATWLDLLKTNVKERTYPTASYPPVGKQVPQAPMTTTNSDSTGLRVVTETGTIADTTDENPYVAQTKAKLRGRMLTTIDGTQVRAADVLGIDFNENMYWFGDDLWVDGDKITQDTDYKMYNLVRTQPEVFFSMSPQYGTYTGMEEAGEFIDL